MVGSPQSAPLRFIPALALVLSLVVIARPGLARGETDTWAAVTSSTWYWQNPLPRDYSVAAIACGSTTACVAVGRRGLIVTTDDGGQQWVERPSGTKIDLQSVACPTSTICYALGFESTGYSSTGQLEGVKTVVLGSADGGGTWRDVATHLPTGSSENLTSLICPSALICLASGYDVGAGTAVPLLRTADGGATWRAANLHGLNSFVDITCATSMICYATGTINGKSGLARSDDGGKTWTRQGLRSPTGVTALSCPSAATCFATAVDCGGECNVGHVYETTNGAKTWKRVYGGASRGIACPSATTCYAVGDQSTFRTTNGGKSWTVRRLPDQAYGGLACPGLSTCYMTAGFGVLATGDGFNHARETLAQSFIHAQTLTEISCPSTTSCYAAGSKNVCPSDGPCGQQPASFAATTDGGQTWRATPTTPGLFERLSCPRMNICLAVDASQEGPIAVARSDDGTQTWHQIRWQDIGKGLFANNQASDITCVGGTTCYLLATVTQGHPGDKVLPSGVAVLVTHDTGRTWGVETGIRSAARIGGTRTANVIPSRISCPSIRTCFVLATVQDLAHSTEQVVLLSTTDGGKSWKRHPTPSGTVPDSGYPPLGQDLSCPATTTCYLISFTQNPQAGNPNGGPGPVLVTHNSGATWRKSVVRKGEYLTAISCTTARSCRVAGISGIAATDNGGKSWQKEHLAGGGSFPLMFSVSCPAVDSCYSIGGPETCCGVMILATHPPGGHPSVFRRFTRPATHRRAHHTETARTGGRHFPPSHEDPSIQHLRRAP